MAHLCEVGGVERANRPERECKGKLRGKEAKRGKREMGEGHQQVGGGREKDRRGQSCHATQLVRNRGCCT